MSERVYLVTITDDNWQPQDGDDLNAIADALDFASIPCFVEECGETT
jgi:hypothetical protein